MERIAVEHGYSFGKRSFGDEFSQVKDAIPRSRSCEGVLSTGEGDTSSTRPSRLALTGHVRRLYLFVSWLQLIELKIAEVLDVDHLIVRLVHGADQFVQLEIDGARVAVLRVLNEEDIRNVTIVVPVLITSCQVSEK
jgi:hypothetical protein